MRAAAAVQAAIDGRDEGRDPLDDPDLDETVRLLLAERRDGSPVGGGAPAQAGAPGAAADPRSGAGAHAGAGADSGAGADAPPERGLPERITASTFHEFIDDPALAERRRLRPVPQRPYRRTRIGNRFHEWVERRATTARGTALPLTGLDLEGWEPELAEFDGEAELRPLIEQFEQSRWAGLQPIAVEQEVTLPFAGRTLVCKLDAVYRFPGHGGAADRFEIVDWKAGRSPRTDAERESRFFQLDLYRHAYAQWAGVDPGRIDVSLFYVAEGVELTGSRPRSLEELEEIWSSAAARLRPAP
jgi:DNA helicase-2/ATP-dependent DNA helicase PcrA